MKTPELVGGCHQKLSFVTPPPFVLLIRKLPISAPTRGGGKSEEEERKRKKEKRKKRVRRGGMEEETEQLTILSVPPPHSTALQLRKSAGHQKAAIFTPLTSRLRTRAPPMSVRRARTGDLLLLHRRVLIICILLPASLLSLSLSHSLCPLPSSLDHFSLRRSFSLVSTSLQLK